jgi:hypothetical protein
MPDCIGQLKFEKSDISKKTNTVDYLRKQELNHDISGVLSEEFISQT